MIGYSTAIKSWKIPKCLSHLFISIAPLEKRRNFKTLNFKAFHRLEKIKKKLKVINSFDMTFSEQCISKSRVYHMNSTTLPPIPFDRYSGGKETLH